MRLPDELRNPSRWQGAIDLAGKGAFAAAPMPMDDAADLFSWYSFCLPTYNQDGPSCVGQAWANWLELMLRRYVDLKVFQPDEQISGEAIWQRGRELFYKGDMDGGLYLAQGFAAMKDLGLVPPLSEPHLVLSEWNSLGRQLLQTPIVQGHRVHDGWFRTNPENGCIDHAPKPDAHSGGHATLLVGREEQYSPEQGRFYVSQNSWGADYGWHGLFLMTEVEWLECAMDDGPYTVLLPAEWTVWRSWEKFVVRK